MSASNGHLTLSKTNLILCQIIIALVIILRYASSFIVSQRYEIKTFFREKFQLHLIDPLIAPFRNKSYNKFALQNSCSIQDVVEVGLV